MIDDVKLNDLDRCIWQEELDEFVPQEIYDTHTHVYDLHAQLKQVPDQLNKISQLWLDWPLVGWRTLDKANELLLPGRRVHRICFGNPLLLGPLSQANEFTAQQVAADPESIGLMLVRPDMTPDELIAQAQQYGLRGVKPYRMHSITGDVDECRITDYLPEKQIAAANNLNMIIMLHLSKSQAIADPENLEDLERLAHAYGNIKWVLAHCARSYYDRPLLKAADRLKNIPNLWYDISSVCDSDAMDALLAIAGPDRVMFASDDIPVGITRGKYITFGHAWAGLHEANHSFNLSACDPRMTFNLYESLRALRRAARRHNYGPQEIEKLFYHNARQLIAATAKP